MATIQDIESFLALARALLDSNKTDFIKGPEEKLALSQLGISFQDALSMVYELTYKNYYRGPSPDHRDKSQIIWEFGIEDIFEENTYPQTSLYIKLTIRKKKGDLLMMSFHPAVKPIKYSYNK